MGARIWFATLSLLALTAAQSITFNSTNAPNATVCVSGAHIIVARASLESPGYGFLGALKDQILSRIPNSNAVAVPYPATIWGTPVYVDSEPEGVGNMTALVKAYASACPGRKMVLMGYSQGAQVVGDTLLGSDYLSFGSFPKTAGLDQSLVDSVAAVVMMGDPANVAGLSILVGNSTHNGTFPRNNTANWFSTGLADRTVSYCDANDTFCDSGSSLDVHVGYVPEYGTQATDFVVEKFMAANSSSSASKTSTSSSSSASATASTSSSPAGHGNTAALSLVSNSRLYGGLGILQCIAVSLAIIII